MFYSLYFEIVYNFNVIILKSYSLRKEDECWKSLRLWVICLSENKKDNNQVDNYQLIKVKMIKDKPEKWSKILENKWREYHENMKAEIRKQHERSSVSYSIHKQYWLCLILKDIKWHKMKLVPKFYFWSESYDPCHCFMKF